MTREITSYDGFLWCSRDDASLVAEGLGKIVSRDEEVDASRFDLEDAGITFFAFPYTYFQALCALEETSLPRVKAIASPLLLAGGEECYCFNFLHPDTNRVIAHATPQGIGNREVIGLSSGEAVPTITLIDYSPRESLESAVYSALTTADLIRNDPGNKLHPLFRQGTVVAASPAVIGYRDNLADMNGNPNDRLIPREARQGRVSRVFYQARLGSTENLSRRFGVELDFVTRRNLQDWVSYDNIEPTLSFDAEYVIAQQVYAPINTGMSTLPMVKAELLHVMIGDKLGYYARFFHPETNSYFARALPVTLDLSHGSGSIEARVRAMLAETAQKMGTRSPNVPDIPLYGYHMGRPIIDAVLACFRVYDQAKGDSSSPFYPHNNSMQSLGLAIIVPPATLHVPPPAAAQKVVVAEVTAKY